jgi:ribosomal protein L37AE/L43A
MAIDEKKPSKNEDEYFARLDAEIMKERRARLDAEREKRDRSTHFNKCPKCGCDLVAREHHNVKVDECQECGGVWLDKGELDMIEEFGRRDSGFMSSLFRLKH